MHNREVFMRHRHQGFLLALLYAVIGAIIGSVLGRMLAPVWSPLGHNYFQFGSSPQAPWTLNLGVIGIQLGLWLTLNLGGIIGLIGGLFWYQRRG